MSGIKVHSKDDLPLNTVLPGARMWAVGLRKSMLTYFELEPDTVFPEHRHEAEQITMVIEGELTFEYGGKRVTLKPGEVIAIPSNEPHAVITGPLPCRAVDAWSPLKKEYVFRLKDAAPEDMPFIKEHVENLRLDDEDIEASQFIVAMEGLEPVGFGRIRPHGEVYELGSIGVIEERRGLGVGSMIVERLIRDFPSDDVFITTDIPVYFERFGFRRVEGGPKELEDKLMRTCRSKGRGEAVVMMLDITRVQSRA